MALVTDLEAVKCAAAAQHDAFMVMGYLLQRMEAELSDGQIDVLVDAVAAPIIAAIDCTACANCCRSLDVYLTQADAQRLAAGIDVPLAALLATHIDREGAAQVDEWGRFKARPCAFLRGKLCSVYAHRPQTCRTYPALTPDFRWLFADIVAGAGLCPIIYNTLMALLPRVEALSRGEG